MNPPPTHRLDLEGQLALEADGQPLALDAHGSTLAVRLGSVGGARRALAALPASRTRGQQARRLQAALARAGLVLEVHIAGLRVAQLADDTRPNWAARLLGLAPGRLHLANLLRAVLRRS